MSMKSWLAMEQMHGQAGIANSWTSLIDCDFHIFRNLFLSARETPARFATCPRSCGCEHAVRAEADGHFRGVCRCNPWNCDDLVLSRDDLTVWELDWDKLGRALCAAFDLNVRRADLGIPKTCQIGAWSAEAVPVWLTVQESAQKLRSAIAELLGRIRNRVIVFGPTNQWLDAHTHELLAHSGAAFFSLACEASISNGRLQPRVAPGQLFSAFQPSATDATSESVAIQALALVRQLDSAQPGKPPLLSTVLRLYCMENLTAAQIAQRCRCSKATIINRLKVLRAKLGRDVAQLRRMASVPGSAEANDSRAKSIHGRSLL